MIASVFSESGLLSGRRIDRKDLMTHCPKQRRKNRMNICILRISGAELAVECGVCEFIVDGSTQECQSCGALMFRTDVAEYQFLKKVLVNKPLGHRPGRRNAPARGSVASRQVEKYD